MSGKCLNALEVGSRVWAASGLHEQGRDKVNVPGKTGGTVIRKWKEFGTLDNFSYAVRWDTGQDTVHYFDTLYCIGQSKTDAEFLQAIFAEAERAKLTRGPSGGVRGFRILLKNGDWIEGMSQLVPQLEERKIPVDVEQLERKKRRHG